MAWVTITEADVQTRLAGAELSSYRSAAKAQGQVDPLPEIISNVVAEVRGHIAACERNTLGDGETIPEKLMHTALALIRYRLITRLPLTVSEERKEEYRDATELLHRVADCKFAVEEPETASDDEVIASSSPSFTERTRNFTRADQDGA